MSAFFPISALVNCLAGTALGTFVFLRRPRDIRNQTYFLFSISVAIWSYNYFFWQISEEPFQALLFCRLLMGGAIFIPIFYLHHLLTLLGEQKSKKNFLIGCYIFGVIALAADTTPFFVSRVESALQFRYWPKPGWMFAPFLIIWIGIIAYTEFLILFLAIRSKGALKAQMLFIFAGTFLGYLGGATNFFLWYDIPIPPYGNILILCHVLTTAYVIIRHRLMDIDVIIKKTLIFAGLFGILILLAGVLTAVTQSYVGRLIGMGQTARQILSILIVIVLFDPLRKILMNLTDKFLFQRKYDYHKLLKDASRGMSNIESLEHLLGLVVHFVTMKMRVRNAAVLMREGASDQYQLIYQRGFDKKFLTLTLYQNDPLIHYLENHKEAVDIERIKEQVEGASHQRDKSEKAYDYEAIRERMNQLQASCCVPSFLGRELRNILMLGEKKSGEYYSNEDLNLLYTLAQESSIAIENARLYDEALRKSHELEHINEQLEHSKTLLTDALQQAEGANKQLQDTQAQLIHEQKMATLGRLAASVGHEVNNPLTILSMNVSRVILKHRKNQDMKVSEILDVFDKMEKNIERIKAVVNTLTGLLKKSEKGKFEPLSLKLILEETLPLVQFQTYLDNLSGTEVDFNVPGNVPLIRGDLERLQEVFLNLFINAYHAMAGKRHRKIGVQAEIDPRNPDMVAIHFRDNGSGMTEEIAKKVFNYGYTTKAPGKGSGLGLYMCKYIIELHGGTISVASKVGEGTTFTLTLPAYSEMPLSKQA